MTIGKNGTCKVVCLFILGLLFSTSSFATPNLMTFQSRIVKPDGKALEGAAVSFRFSITDALGTCVIYQEDFANRNMSGSKGLINLNLGGGTKVYPVSAMDLSEVFNNYNFPTFNCQSGGTVNAGSTDRRRLVMQFNDGSGWQTVPAMDINSNPYALQAAKAYSLGDYPAADYLRTATLPNCNPATHALTFNGTNFTCIAAGGAGAGTVTNVTSANNDIAVATGSSTPVLTLNSTVAGAADKIVKLDGSGNFGAINASALTNLNASALASGTVAGARLPALTGDVTMAAGTTSTTIANSAITDAKVAAGAGIARSKLAAGTNNSILINNATGVLSDLFCADNQMIKWIDGEPTCSTDDNSGGDVNNSGNSYAGAMTIGTNDNNTLSFETNGTTKMTVLANGNVGIGATNPSAPIEVSSSSVATSGSINGAKISNTLTPGGATFMLSTTGLEVISSGAGNQGFDNVSGATFRANSGATAGTVSSVTGIYAFTNTTGAGNVGVSRALQGLSFHNGTGTITSAFGVDAAVKSFNAGTTISDGRAGNFSVDRTAGTITNGYGVYVGNIQATNKWSVFASDATAPSSFAGSVGIGVAGVPARPLHVNGPMRMEPSVAPGAPAAGDMYVDSGDSNKLKVYDGSGWVLASGGGGGGGGGVTNVSSANSDIGVGNGSSTPLLTLNSTVAGAADKIVKLDGSGNLGAINASALTNLNASNLASGTVPAARMPALTGDVTTAAGAVATTIAANAVTSAKIADDEIVDADVKSNAAIARSKLAAGTGDHVLINTAGGVMSSEAQLAVSRGGTGLASYTNNALIMANGTGTALTNATCNVGEILMWNVTTWSCTSMASSSQGYFKDGGNTFTGTATLGTNSNHNLEIETNGTTKMTVLANGNVGIGTAAPSSSLEITGNLTFTNGGNRTLSVKDVSGVAANNLDIKAGSVTAGAAAAGGALNLYGGNGRSVGAGGAVLIQSGNGGTIGQAGPLTIKVGQSSTTPAADLTIQGGLNIGDAGGNVVIKGGDGATDGGAIQLTGGAAGVGLGGSGGGITLNGGAPNGAGQRGSINLATLGGNVGIGTSSPTAALTINGDTHFTNSADRTISVRPTAGVTPGKNLTISSGATTGTLSAGALNLFGGDASSGTNGGAVNLTAGFGFNNGGTVNISGGQNDLGVYSNIFLAPSGGNVGIGTISPTTKLSVVAPSTTLYASSSGATNTPILTTSAAMDLKGGASTYLGMSTVSNLEEPQNAYIGTIKNNGGFSPEIVIGVSTGINSYAERMRISAGGNVGIGTTSPGRLLHVAGPMRITPTALPGVPAAGDVAIDSGDSNKLKFFDGSGWVATGASGTVTNVSSANADIAVVNGGSTPQLTLNAGTGNNQIVKLNGTAELPAVSGVNLTALNASNLGSGTVPAARMPALTGDVTTAAGAVATTIAANAVTSAKIADDEIVDADIKSNAAIARSKLAAGTGDHVLINTAGGVMSSEAQLAVSRGGTGLASYTNNALIMANGTGTALTNATCNVGEILMWNATTWACTDISATQGFFKNGGNTMTGTATMGTNSNHNLEIETNGSTRMTVLANGYIGIGKSDPDEAIDVNGNVKAFGSIKSNFGFIVDYIGMNNTLFSAKAAGLEVIKAYTSMGNGKLELTNISPAIGVKLDSSGDSYFTGGNVGIGTATPGAALDINGDLRFTKAADRMISVQDSTGFTAGRSITIQPGAAANGGGGALNLFSGAGSIAGANINIQPATSGMIYGNIILGEFGGNVGVGTNSPEATLDVNGTVAANASIEGTAAFVNSGAAYTIPDTSLNIRRITADDNTTITLPAFAPVAVRVFTLTVFIKQDGTGGRTVAWAGGGSTIKWDSNVAPTISAAAGKTTIIQFTKVSDESVWYASMVWKED